MTVHSGEVPKFSSGTGEKRETYHEKTMNTSGPE